MNHYLYTPGNPESGTEARLEFVADTAEDMRIERFAQIHAATTAYLTTEEPGVGLTERVEEVLCADFGRLPVGAMARQLSDQATGIVEAGTGLYMYADHGIGSEVGELEVNIMPISHFPEVTDDPLERYNAHRGSFTHYGYQSELVTSKDGTTKLLSDRDHFSLGILDSNGDFVPQLTLLNADHPLRVTAQAAISASSA